MGAVAVIITIWGCPPLYILKKGLELPRKFSQCYDCVPQSVDFIKSLDEILAALLG